MTEQPTNSEPADVRAEAGAEMSSMSDGPAVGERLKQARLAAGISLDDLAAELNIRRRHLEALEAGDSEAMPGFAYAVGFVRSCAAQLGLPVEELADQYKAECGEDEAQPALTFPQPEPQGRRAPGFAILASSLAAAVMIYFGIVRDDTPADPAPDVAELESMASLEPVADAPSAASGGLQRAKTTKSEDVSNARAEAADKPRRAVSVTGLQTDITDTARAATARETAGRSGDDRTNEAIRRAAEQAVRPMLPGRNAWVISAVQDVWVHVATQDGTSAFSGMLRQGQRRVIPAAPGLMLTASNAAGLSIQRGGEVYAELGGYGRVLKDVALTPDGLASLGPLALR